MLILLISGLMLGFMIKDTNKTIQKEMYIMRSQVLDEVANNISILLSNVETIGNTIVVDSKLMRILGTSTEEISTDKKVTKEMSSYVEGMLSDEIWKYGKFNMKPELYIIGENGLTYSTYSKTKYDIDKIKNESWYEEIVKADGDTVLINTYKDENGVGPYKNIFKMGRLIKDLITKEILGVLIIDVSETMLYDRYSELLEVGGSIYIVDSKGKIISSKDKRIIGKNYDKIISNDTNKEKLDTKYIKITSSIDEFGWSMVQEIPLNIMMQISNRIIKKSLVLIVVISLIAVIITYKLSVSITNPIIKIKNKMNEVMQGNLKAQVHVDSNDEIGELQTSFNSMVSRLESSIEEIKIYEEQKRIAELSFLQAQINPHFLYNTLSGIRFLISMNKNEQAEDMLYKFTKLLRSILPKSSEMINLEEEIENIKNYSDLQLMRYPGSFEIIYNIDENIYEFKVPSFILQPIVENAILYSMEKENNKGIISVIAYENEDGIRIIVEDNGIGMSKDKVNTVLKKEASINRIGVINVHERIQLIYGPDYGLQIDSIEQIGTKVTFILPK
ncbi:MAG: sensor histidine kinase [Terrisporobacter sp.]|uniref:sensor histidine kinase n=1 Tax=Terrisporobacter sp. TaxID=1965305 RepID=UPI002FCC777B